MYKKCSTFSQPSHYWNAPALLFPCKRKKFYLLPFMQVLSEWGNNHMDTSADALQPTSILKWLRRQLQCSKCCLSSACVTAAKQLPVLLLKTSGTQRLWAAGDKQCLCHHSCFCSEYLLTAFQRYQEKVTEIHTHSAIKTHAKQPGGHMYCHIFMYCHVLHVLPLRKYEVAHKREYTTFTCFNEIL